MTRHDTATDVRREHVRQRQPVDTLSTQPTDVANAPHEPGTPSSGRRRTRTIAIIAAVAILLGITAGVMVLRSDDIPETVARSAEDVHAADWQLENQARRLNALRADADRFAGRYSNSDGRAPAQPPTTPRNGNDTHLLNQAKKLESSHGRADADQQRGRPGLTE